MPEIVGDSINRHCAIDIRYRPVEKGLPRGIIPRLYEATRPR